RDPRGVAMPTEAGEVLGAARQRLVEMKSLDAPARSLGDAVLFAEDERGPVEPIDQPAGDDAGHADVPSLRRNDERAPLAQFLRLRDRLVGDARLQLLPLGVRAVQFFRQSTRLRRISTEQE